MLHCHAYYRRMTPLTESNWGHAKITLDTTTIGIVVTATYRALIFWNKSVVYFLQSDLHIGLGPFDSGSDSGSELFFIFTIFFAFRFFSLIFTGEELII